MHVSKASTQKPGGLEEKVGPNLDQLDGVCGIPPTCHLASLVLSPWLDKMYTFFWRETVIHIFSLGFLIMNNH